jgi:hypothetical protein
MMSEAKINSHTQFFWRLDEDGTLKLRWGVVMLLSAGVLLGNALGQFVLYVALQVPFRFGIVSAMTSVQLGLFAIAIELQRQKLLVGKYVFRFNLTTLFLLTLFASLFVGAVVAEQRHSQRGIERNKEVTAQLEQLIGAGNISIGALNGKRISCLVTNPAFSDAELELLISATKFDQFGISEITMLQLENTSITEVGIRKLVDCKKLEFLALPQVKLSDSAIEAIALCQNLEYISIGQRSLTQEQANHLYEKLPYVKINGLSHEENASRNKIQGK